MPFAPGPPVPKNTCHGSAWSTGAARPARRENIRASDDGVVFITARRNTLGAHPTRPKPGKFRGSRSWLRTESTMPARPQELRRFLQLPRVPLATRLVLYPGFCFTVSHSLPLASPRPSRHSLAEKENRRPASRDPRRLPDSKQLLEHDLEVLARGPASAAGHRQALAALPAFDGGVNLQKLRLPGRQAGDFPG